MHATVFEFWALKIFLWGCFSFVCLSLIGFPSFVFHRRNYKIVLFTLLSLIPLIIVISYFSEPTKAILFYGYDDTVTTFERLRHEKPEWFHETTVKCR